MFRTGAQFYLLPGGCWHILFLLLALIKPVETVTGEPVHLTLPQAKAWLLSGMLYAYLCIHLQEDRTFASSDKNNPVQVLFLHGYKTCQILHLWHHLCSLKSLTLALYLQTRHALIHLPAAFPQNSASLP